MDLTQDEDQLPGWEKSIEDIEQMIFQDGEVSILLNHLDEGSVVDRSTMGLPYQEYPTFLIM